MNTSLKYCELTPVEKEVTELYAWGCTKKEIALKRGKSIRTINNQLDKLFKKTGTHKDTEFTAWYFCSKFKISFDLSPVKQAIISICLLIVLGIGAMNDDGSVFCRTARARTSRTMNARGSRGGRSKREKEEN